MRGRVTIATGVLLALVFVAGGCAGTAANEAAVAVRDGGPPAVHPRWESCAAVPVEGTGLDGGTDALPLPRLDDSFAPVAAVLCRTGPQRRPGGGEDWVAVEERAGDVAALVAALRLPDEERTDGICTSDLVRPPWLVLLDARGRWIRPGVPVDGCGKPRREFRAAVEQLRTDRVSSRVLREIESDRAAAAGCSQVWADMVWVAGRYGKNGVPGALAAGDAEVRVCVYRVPASERGSSKPAGQFESGRTLTAGTWAAVRRELAATAAAGACTTPAGRFAVAHTPAGLIYVEADGCQRVLIDNDSALRTGTAKLRSLLF
jgi:hypothetical protein